MTKKLFTFTRFDIIALVILILSSFIFLVDTIFFSGQPANMDGVVHVTNIAIFHEAISDGDFPVRWTDGFANYGLPMGSFAQQFTSYLGGFITLLTNDVITSFNIVYVIGTVASLLLLYWFLRLHFKEWPSLVGAFIFNFAPYRIVNIYIRGALPEYFSSVFLVAILISLHYIFKKKTIWAHLGLALSIFGMILSHPMNVITSSLLIGPYFLYLLFSEKERISKLKLTVSSAISVVMGIVLSGYYLVPLLRDVQFLFYGNGSGNHYNASHLGVANFLDPNWYYYLVQNNEILSRGHFITVGLFETLLFGVGALLFIFRRVKKQKISFFDISILVGTLTLFLTTQFAAPIYTNIDFISNIQFSWRMLSTFIFIPPIIIAAILQLTKKKTLSYAAGVVVILVIALNRFPQVYGKNFTQFPDDHYYFTIDNLHTANMNTIWTIKTTEYSVHKKDKVAILEGEAELSNIKVSNSNRSYTVNAQTELSMIDYTFYFPGWKVYIDGVETPIEFQDIENRGVITYTVPAGQHSVEVKFTQTKTVLLGNLLTLLGFGSVLLIMGSQKVPKIKKLTTHLIQ
jgi:hypothetical protein